MTELDPREIKLGSLLGEGAFGKVYAGVCRNTRVAVKVIDRSRNDPGEKAFAQFQQEMAIVSRLLHPNICLYMGSCTSGNELMLVTERLDCDLETYIYDCGKSLPISVRLLMGRDVALGLAWLHQSEPIVLHRDVKPSNVLVDKGNRRVKLTDFGLSQLRERGESLFDEEDAVGTPLYMAPEVLHGDSITEKSDIYSFGLVVHFLASMQRPFTELDHLSNDSFSERIIDGHRPPLPKEWSRALRDLIAHCLEIDPRDRPTAAQLVDMFGGVIVSTAVRDPTAQKFWSDAFLRTTDPFDGQADVQWTQFVDALHEFFDKRFHRPLVDMSTDIDELALRHLRKLVEVDGVVQLERFGRFIDYFGPLDADILDRMHPILSEAWFHGHVSTSEAETRLSPMSPGTFLVRFSSSSSSAFYTLSRKANATTIHHQRIGHEPMGDTYKVGNRTYSSLNALIDGERDALHLLQAAPGSVFSTNTDLVGGYVVDDDASPMSPR